MKLKLCSISSLTLSLLLILVNQSHAQNYITIQLAAQHDTVMYCPGPDSLLLMAPAQWDKPGWIFNNYDDTVYTNSIILPNGYEGYIFVNSMQYEVKPLKISNVNDKTALCEGSVQFDYIYTNYAWPGGVITFLWTPSAGLNNPRIPNPVARVDTITDYIVSVGFPEGCIIKDTVRVRLQLANPPPICLVGINSENHNEIVWERPAIAYYDTVYIYRETHMTNIYQKIGAVAFSDPGIFVDIASNPNIQSNKYRVAIKDACGFESNKSNAHKTMHLAINMGQNNSWNLIWEPYEGFEVVTYMIYRGTTQDDLQIIGSASGSGRQFTDFSPPQGFVFYQLEVFGPNLCNPNKKADTYYASRSNIATNKPTGLNNPHENTGSFTVYPNPADKEIIVRFTTGGSLAGIIEIIDLSGQIIKKVDLFSENTTIPISDLTAGMYFVRIKNYNKITLQKFTKKT